MKLTREQAYVLCALILFAGMMIMTFMDMRAVETLLREREAMEFERENLLRDMGSNGHARVRSYLVD